MDAGIEFNQAAESPEIQRVQGDPAKRLPGAEKNEIPEFSLTDTKPCRHPIPNLDAR
jgi:hypothetical protein